MSSEPDDIDRVRGPLLCGPLEHTFGFLLRAAWRDASRTFTKYFRSFDINPPQYATLLLVNLNPGCATGDLAETLGITPNNMVRLVDNLAERGFLEKTIHASDKRVRVLRMTAAGRAFFAQLVETHTRYEAEYDARIGRPNLEKLCVLLQPFT